MSVANASARKELTVLSCCSAPLASIIAYFDGAEEYGDVVLAQSAAHQSVLEEQERRNTKTRGCSFEQYVEPYDPALHSRRADAFDLPDRDDDDFRTDKRKS